MSGGNDGESVIKLLMICCSASQLDALRELLERHEVHGYTELPHLRGSGASGRHMATRVWPGSCSMIVTAVDASRVDRVLQAIRELESRCRPAEGLRAMVLPLEQMT